MWTLPITLALRIPSVNGLSDASSLDHSGSLVHAPGMVVATPIMVGFFINNVSLLPEGEA